MYLQSAGILSEASQLPGQLTSQLYVVPTTTWISYMAAQGSQEQKVEATIVSRLKPGPSTASLLAYIIG